MAWCMSNILNEGVNILLLIEQQVLPSLIESLCSQEIKYCHPFRGRHFELRASMLPACDSWWFPSGLCPYLWVLSRLLCRNSVLFTRDIQKGSISAEISPSITVELLSASRGFSRRQWHVWPAYATFRRHKIASKFSFSLWRRFWRQPRERGRSHKKQEPRNRSQCNNQ